MSIADNILHCYFPAFRWRKGITNPHRPKGPAISIQGIRPDFPVSIYLFNTDFHVVPRGVQILLPIVLRLPRRPRQARIGPAFRSVHRLKSLLINRQGFPAPFHVKQETAGQGEKSAEEQEEYQGRAALMLRDSWSHRFLLSRKNRRRG